MTVLSQKVAVKNAITQVLTEAGIHFDDNSNFKSLMTKELRAQVNAILFAGFRAGTIELKKEKSDKDLKEYVSGLQANWLKKDKTMTAGVAYVPQNPGSRTGSNDDQIKALRNLLKTVHSPKEREEIQGYINDRLETLSAAKPKSSKQVVVDYSALPESIRSKYTTQA